MSTSIFPFRFLRRGYREYLSFSTALHEQGAGRRTAQKLHAAGEFVARGSILFPNPGGTWRDFAAFWSARFGGYDPFLFKPQDPGAAAIHEDPEIDSGSQVDFAVARRFVDTATLVVKKNGTTLTLGTHYTLRNESGGAYVLGTSQKLVVHFISAPGLGANLDFDYVFYYPVRFEGDDLPEEQDMQAGGVGSALTADRTVAVRLRETGPGFSYGTVPSAL